MGMTSMKIDNRGNKQNKRIAILSDEEINFYFSLPCFSDTERSHYFSLSEAEYKVNQTLSSATQWYFILFLYFNTRKLKQTLSLFKKSINVTFHEKVLVKTLIAKYVR
ncbi:MAG: hypothetical protein A3F43_06615 [Gammaproteobacteria bacterium RIFCSPHIGHO2_12_FULL_42_10]|nr:MAG: hypothetical protein A3F43_06615 [Gammaproteobacteria bacterium RIFCSPHIGHO2_12_FULL_42_10]